SAALAVGVAEALEAEQLAAAQEGQTGADDALLLAGAAEAGRDLGPARREVEGCRFGRGAGGLAARTGCEQGGGERDEGERSDHPAIGRRRTRGGKRRALRPPRPAAQERWIGRR